MAEAIRIRRRGREGTILNSRGEFGICYIHHLKVEEQEEEKAKSLEWGELMEQESKEADQTWEHNRCMRLGAQVLHGP